MAKRIPFDPTKVVLSKVDPMALVDAIKDTAEFIYAAKQSIAEERTKQAEIRESTRLEIARIQATRELLMTFLDRSFDERRVLFGQYLERMDQAMASEDMTAMNMCLQATLDLAKSSPFKALQDAASFHQALTNKDTEWSF